MNALHAAVERFFLGERNSGRKGAVLDAGAGPGDITKSLQRFGFAVTAVDIEPEFRGCRSANLNNNLPFRAGKFDYIVCLEVAEHIENTRHLIREFSRVIRNGGTLLISTPNIGNIFSRLKFLLTGEFFCFSRYERKLGHINPVPPWLMQESLEASGFRVVGVKASEYLRLSGLDNANVQAKRFAARLAYALLRPFLRPKNREFLKADSLIFFARKIGHQRSALQQK